MGTGHYISIHQVWLHRAVWQLGARVGPRGPSAASPADNPNGAAHRAAQGFASRRVPLGLTGREMLPTKRSKVSHRFFISLDWYFGLFLSFQPSARKTNFTRLGLVWNFPDMSGWTSGPIFSGEVRFFPDIDRGTSGGDFENYAEPKKQVFRCF